MNKEIIIKNMARCLYKNQRDHSFSHRNLKNYDGCYEMADDIFKEIENGLISISRDKKIEEIENGISDSESWSDK